MDLILDSSTLKTDGKGGPQLGFWDLADLLPGIGSDVAGWRDPIYLPRLGVLVPGQSRM